MTRQGLLSSVINAAADRLARDPRIPDGNRLAYRETAVCVLRSQFAVLFGERVYVSRDPQQERALRRARIVQALAAGEEARSIARRERVSERWVRALRARNELGPCVPGGCSSMDER